MDSTTLFFSSIIGLVIWALILQSIISAGSRSKKILLQMQIQSLLLSKIAEKQGISAEEISKILSIKE